MKAHLLSALIFGILPACASSGKRPGGDASGSYRFVQRVNDAIPPVTLEGTITIVGGEVSIDLLSFPCRTGVNSTSRTARFECLDVDISVDRLSPQTRASYRIRTLVRHAVRECVEYQTTSTGARRCVREQTRYEERPGIRYGQLQLVPIPR